MTDEIVDTKGSDAAKLSIADLPNANVGVPNTVANTAVVPLGTGSAIAGAPDAVSKPTPLDLLIAGSATPPETVDPVIEPEAPAVKVPTAEEIAETIQFLYDAQERMAVNALSDAGIFIGRAIQILEG